MKVYFVRHGETTWNKRSRLQGQKDIPLTAAGLEQARLTSEGMKELPFDCIFASPLKRAYITADIIRRQRDLPIHCDDRLKEIDFGTYNGRRFDKIRDNPKYTRCQKFFTDPLHYHPPKGGEDFNSLVKRAVEFYEERIVPLEGTYENVLVVTHNGIIRSLLIALNGRSIADYWNTPFGKNCASVLFECKEGKTEMIYENKIYY